MINRNFPLSFFLGTRIPYTDNCLYYLYCVPVPGVIKMSASPRVGHGSIFRDPTKHTDIVTRTVKFRKFLTRTDPLDCQVSAMFGRKIVCTIWLTRPTWFRSFLNPWMDPTRVQLWPVHRRNAGYPPLDFYILFPPNCKSYTRTNRRHCLLWSRCINNTLWQWWDAWIASRHFNEMKVASFILTNLLTSTSIGTTNITIKIILLATILDPLVIDLITVRSLCANCIWSLELQQLLGPLFFFYFPCRNWQASSVHCLRLEIIEVLCSAYVSIKLFCDKFVAVNSFNIDLKLL